MPRKKKLQEVGGLRLVAYYRYSNGGQQTEQSIEGQRRDCEAYAKAHGYKIVHEYIDRHISGKSDSRPAFQQMISDMENGEIGIIVTKDLLENRPPRPQPLRLHHLQDPPAEERGQDSVCRRDGGRRPRGYYH